MPPTKRYWDDVKEGQALPEVRVDKLTRTDFVKYAGASGDFNPIHHDQGFAEASGNPTVFAGHAQREHPECVITGFAGRPRQCALQGALRHARVAGRRRDLPRDVTREFEKDGEKPSRAISWRGIKGRA